MASRTPLVLVSGQLQQLQASDTLPISAINTAAVSNDATMTSAGAVTITGLKGTVFGLNLSYTSSTSITVGTGQARDSTNATMLTLSSAGTISSSTLGAINGLDRKAISGTVTTSTSNSTITGSGTSFLSAFGTRTGTGTIVTSGTTVTGTGTKFLSEVSPGDLIGTPAKGFARVSSVDSDTVIQTITAIPGGSPGGAAPLIIENAWFQAASQTVQRINSITSDTTLNLAGNSSATASGATAQIGALPSSQAALHVYLATGNSGTGVYLSTQRTTPYGISGYTSNFRRIGSVMWTGSAFFAFLQYGNGAERWYQYEIGRGTNSTQILANAANTSWTNVLASGCVPPTATYLRLGISVVTGGTAGLEVHVRARGSGDSTTTRNLYAALALLNAAIQVTVDCACDANQAIDYVTSNTSSGNGAYLYVVGYQESLK